VERGGEIEKIMRERGETGGGRQGDRRRGRDVGGVGEVDRGGVWRGREKKYMNGEREDRGKVIKKTMEIGGGGQTITGTA